MPKSKAGRRTEKGERRKGEREKGEGRKEKGGRSKGERGGLRLPPILPSPFSLLLFSRPPYCFLGSSGVVTEALTR
jgi:hypothetical protein